MDHYEGKIFTNVISKEPVPVIIQTTTNRIQGDLHLRQEERMKDTLNHEEAFMAITNAVVFDPAGQILFNAGFMTINKQEIVWIVPQAEINKTEPTE